MKNVLLVLMLCFSINAVAQQTGEIILSVVDGAGQPLPGVVVTAQSPELVGQRTGVTRANGDFVFRLLPPGEYTITATMTGMKTGQANLLLGLGQVLRPEIVLTPAATDE